ncbi:MAG: DUF72 domain-containing protein [Burkholderiaceae bacterium]
MRQSDLDSKTAQELLSGKEERRQKREERRAKQRVANVARAEKMHALRIQGGKDNQTQLTRASPMTHKSDAPKWYVGCSGWFYWRWRGDFYPETLPTNQWFSHYASHFKTVELNASFYSWPTETAVKTWIKQAGEQKFIYTVKVCELITHVKRFDGVKTLVKDFGFIADLLGTHMGCFLFQFAPSFQYSTTRLKAILSQLDHTRRNVLEFRHASWWNEDVFAALRETGTIFCSCSGPRLPDQLVKTADDIYLRLHGTKQWYRHDYSEEELSVWSERIHESGAKRVWVYFNNDYEGFATKNAHLFSSLLRV